MYDHRTLDILLTSGNNEGVLNGPFFIIGNPRSGTSLLRSIINSHENIVVPPECGFLQWLRPKHGNFPDGDLGEFFDDLFKTKKIEGWQLHRGELVEFIEHAAPTNYPELCGCVYHFYGTRSGKEINFWGDKNNYYIHHLAELVEIYPDAKFIHIVRNPKDVIKSYLEVIDLPDSKYKPNLPAEILDITRDWCDNNSKVSSFLTKNKYAYLQLHYENLLIRTGNTVEDICQFLGVDSNDVLDNFEKNKYFDEPEITLNWKRNLANTVDRGNYNTYRSRLTDDQIKEIDVFIRKQNIDFTYIDF